MNANVQSSSKEISHRALSFTAGGLDRFHFGRMAKARWLHWWCRHKPTVSSQNKMLSPSFITMQEFNQIPTPVAIYCLDSILSTSPAMLCVSCLGKGFCSQRRTLICKALLFKKTKEAAVPSPFVLLISHIMTTLITPCILPSSTTI